MDRNVKRWRRCQWVFCSALFVSCFFSKMVSGYSLEHFACTCTKHKYTSKHKHTPHLSKFPTDKQMSAQLSVQTRPSQPLGLRDLCCLSKTCSPLVIPPMICMDNPMTTTFFFFFFFVLICPIHLKNCKQTEISAQPMVTMACFQHPSLPQNPYCQWQEVTQALYGLWLEICLP